MADARRKYKVEPDGTYASYDGTDVRQFLVTRLDDPKSWPDRIGVSVYADGDVRCMECSGLLRACLAHCPHTAAVKRHLGIPKSRPKSTAPAPAPAPALAPEPVKAGLCRREEIERDAERLREIAPMLDALLAANNGGSIFDRAARFHEAAGVLADKWAALTAPGREEK